jgi:hypothetical protein
MPCHKPALHDVAVMLKQRISAVSDGHLFVFFFGGHHRGEDHDPF